MPNNYTKAALITSIADTATVDLDVTAGQLTAIATSSGYTSEAGIVAFAGGGQLNATVLTKDINRIDTAGAAGASVKPNVTATAPFRMTVQNDGANAIDFFPFLGNNFRRLGEAPLAANAALSIEPGNEVTVVCYTAGELTLI